MNYPFNITSAELRKNYSRVDHSSVYVHNEVVPVLRDNGFFKKSGGELNAVEVNELGLEVIVSYCADTEKTLRIVVARPNELPAEIAGKAVDIEQLAENIPFTD